MARLATRVPFYLHVADKPGRINTKCLLHSMEKSRHTKGFRYHVCLHPVYVARYNGPGGDMLLGCKGCEYEHVTDYPEFVDIRDLLKVGND